MMYYMKPELLIPVGNLEKLKIAVYYGADAVYLGGQKFGLRSAADNFSIEEIRLGVSIAHQHQCKVYVTLNSYLHDDEIDQVSDYALEVCQTGIDAFIVSDLGVIHQIQKVTDTPIHLSTQASCLNSQSALFWHQMGIKRIVVGRELSIEESSLIKSQVPIEIEMFIHGAMCSAYSGFCTISNYTAGRDSNRGGCKQSCRFPYDISTQEQKKVSNQLLSSKDLNGLEMMPYFFQHQIDSLKVEGRMKSALYIATMTSCYRQAIDSYINHQWNQSLITQLQIELDKAPHRQYHNGNLTTPADDQSICKTQQMHMASAYQFIGIIKQVTSKNVLVHLRNPLKLETNVEIVLPFGKSISLKIDSLQNIDGQSIDSLRQENLAWIPYFEGAQPCQVLRQIQEVSI